MDFRKIILFVFVLFGPFSLLYFLNSADHIFVEPPYIGGYEVINGDTVHHKVPAFQLKSSDGKPLDLDNKIVVLFPVQNTCYDPDSIYNCGYYPFHIEEILYDDLHKNKKKYNDLIIVSVVTDENGNSVPPNEKLISKFESYDSDIWKLAVGEIKPYYDFVNEEGMNYLTLKNKTAYNGKSYLSTLLLIDKKRHIRGYFGGRMNAEVREFKDRISVLKKFYQSKKN